jgi:hypothetical protein
MSKRKILLQLDADAQPSVFDSVVAVDSGVDFLFRHGQVKSEDVRGLVHGTIFTRGLDDLRHTAVFVGGADVAAGERLLKEVRQAFFGPFRVSAMMDSNGANTTAVAAVLAAAKHIQLAACTALVLGGTGPVGQRVARLLAKEGANVRVASRSAERAQAVCDTIRSSTQNGSLVACSTKTAQDVAAALEGAQLVIAAGAAGVELLSAEDRPNSPTLKVAIDLNAVPPVGLAGIEPTDRGMTRDGAVCYGALGVGGLKMKIHRRSLEKLFEKNDLILDAEEIFEIGRELSGA